MRGKPIQWLGIISALSCLIWIFGLAWTLQVYFSDAPPVAPVERPVSAGAEAKAGAKAGAVQEASAQVAGDGSFRMLVLGDSLARGTGDREGQGFGGYLAELLDAKTEGSITWNTLGVDGQTSEQLAESLQQERVRREVTASNKLLVSIGGNDLFQGGETLANLDLDKIRGLEEQYNNKLYSILSELRSINADADIYLIGLYNPFMELKDSETTSKVVRDWNYKAAETAAKVPKTVAVPTYDLFQLNVRSYLSGDKFHPNSDGYRLIAERLASLMNGGG